MSDRLREGAELLRRLETRTLPTFLGLLSDLGLGGALPLAPMVLLKLLLVSARVSLAVSSRRREWVNRQALELPPIPVEVHPLEIEAFFRPRPWYRRVFAEELRYVGEYRDLLSGAMRILPGGKPAAEGGVGYRTSRWRGRRLVKELFQDDWEKRRYRVIAQAYCSLDSPRYSLAGLPRQLEPFAAAELEVARIQERRFRSFLARQIIQQVAGLSLWRDRRFWRDLRRVLGL